MRGARISNDPFPPEDDESAGATQQVVYALPAQIAEQMSDKEIEFWHSLSEGDRRRDLKEGGFISSAAHTATARLKFARVW
jgi:hypothetical protein